MAFGMKHWLGVVLLGVGLIAAWLLPVDYRMTRRARPEVVDPVQERFLGVQHEVLVEAGRLSRLRRLDSLTALLEPPSVAGSPVTVGLPPGLPPDEVAVFEARLGREVQEHASIAAADVGVFVILVPPPEAPGALRRERQADEFYAGEHRGRPYCMAVRVAWEESRGILVRGGWDGSMGPGGPSVTGPCAYFLRYGAPGPRVAEWLRDGSFERGSRRAVSTAWIEDRVQERMPFGMSTFASWDVSIPGQRCIRGELEVCRDIFLHPERGELTVAGRIARGVPELWLTERTNPRRAFALADLALFADLEEEFGGERFARFWTSEKEVTAAFEEAFGLSPERWIRGWGSGYYGTEWRGYEAGLGHWGVTLLLVAAALTIAAAAAHRRQVA